MELFITLLIGIAIGALVLYFVDHKHNLSYTLTTLKEDIHNLSIKLEKYFSSIK